MNTMVNAPKPNKSEFVPTYDARDLMRGGTQICIILDNQRYFLRITRSGKLILTK